jgi:hypothetical protein
MKEVSMAIRRILPQPDLFETPPPRMALNPAERTNLVDQLRVLLMEALAAPEAAAGSQDRSEAGDDEDHA